MPLRLAGAEVLVRDRISAAPLLVRHGNTCFSALGFSPEAAGYFQAVVRSLAAMPVGLESTGEMRILEGVAKGDSVCLALWGRGQGRLSVDLRALSRSRLPGGIVGQVANLSTVAGDSTGWKPVPQGSPARQAGPTAVTDIVTGAVLAQATAEQLAAGIPIEIKYPNQPLVLVIGPAGQAEPAKGDVTPRPRSFAACPRRNRPTTRRCRRIAGGRAGRYGQRYCRPGRAGSRQRAGRAGLLRPLRDKTIPARSGPIAHGGTRTVGRGRPAARVGRREPFLAGRPRQRIAASGSLCPPQPAT